MTVNPSRRTFLQNSAALVATGATTSLSGCVGDLLGTSTDSGSSITTVGKWWPAKAATSGAVEGPTESYGLTYVSLESVVEATDRVDGDLLQGVTFRFDDRFGAFDVSPEDVTFRLYNSHWDVLRWDHDPSDPETVLDEAGFEPASHHREFTIYASGSDAGGSGERNDHPDEHRVFAFDGTVLVHTSRLLWQDGAAIDGVERLIDTHAGEFERFADENDTIGGLLERARAGDTLSISQFDSLPTSEPLPKYGFFEGLSARCLSGRFDGERFQRQDLFQFPDREAVDMDAIETYVEALDDEDDGFGHATETTVNRQSGLVEVSSTLPLESLVE
jgi:hypothetical protein